MDVFRVGEALLRSPQPLLPFLAPTAYRVPQTSRTAAPIVRHCRNPRTQCQPSRALSTSHPPQRPAAQAAAARYDPSSDETPQGFPSTTPSSPHGGLDADLSSLLDRTLDQRKGTPTAPASRTSHFSSPNARENNPSSRRFTNDRQGAGDASRTPARDRVSDILNGLGRGNTAPRTTSTGASLLSAIGKSPDSRRPNAASSSSTKPEEDSVEDLMNSIFDGKSGTKRQQLSSSGPPSPDDDLPPMKLGPTIGRTVHVNVGRNMDIGRAFRTLEIQCARNSVRRDFMRQRFHERPGLKRKRLKSERWRKNFRKNFKGVVSMVQKMERQGW